MTQINSSEDQEHSGISVEELSDGEEFTFEKNKGNDNEKSISTMSLDLNRPTSPPVFGSVSVNKSENVHFGNNTYFNGPVTIKQLVQTNAGQDNAGFSTTEGELRKTKQPPDNKNYRKENKISDLLWTNKWPIVICIVIITVVLVGVGVLSVRSYNSSNVQPAKETNNEGEELLVAPGHLRIVPRTDWLAQPVEGELEVLHHPVPWVIISHSATEQCHTQAECVLNVRLIQMFHIESRKWYDIGYNFLVGGDGSAYEGRGWDYVGAHTLGYNHNSIGISFIGTFTTVSPTENQLEACRNLLELGVKLGKLAKDYKLFAHRQLWSTNSPGDKVFEIIKTWPHFETNLNATKRD